MPIDPQTSNAEILVIFNSYVKTTPSPQIDVRKVTNETANATQLVRVDLSARWPSCKTEIKAGTGTPLLFTQPNIRGAWPDLAKDNNIRELA